jgi:hypothetical protein
MKPVKPALVSIQIQSKIDGQMSVQSIDQIDGDRLLSDTVQLSKGPGIYKMFVNKSATPASCNHEGEVDHEGEDDNVTKNCGPEIYTAWFACLKADNVAKRGTWELKQQDK